MNSNSKVTSSVKLFRTAPHACSYRSNEQAATVFVDPDVPISQVLNSKLSDLGYRRSGAHLYRPDCDSCSACISCRLPVARFRFTRRFRKIWNRNQDLIVHASPDLEGREMYRLYRKYINTRHKDGDMYPATPEQFEAFIKTRTDDTRYYAFRCADKLVAVSVLDELEQGLSAVYTFFDPELGSRSLGIYIILWQIRLAASLGLSYVYLGYWIKDCPKMNYKVDFRPIEMLIEGKWLLVK